MTRPRKNAPGVAEDQSAVVTVEVGDQGGEAPPTPSRRELLAKLSVRPEMRHSMAAMQYTAPFMGEEADWGDLTTAYQDQMGDAAKGDLKNASRMLMAQALTLDSIFTRMAERAAVNMREFPDATKKYMLLALKAQANSRATLEALARIHQPREQIVKHVNVNEGGQAVFAGQIHQHQQWGPDHENANQPHGPSAAMLGQDTEGNGVSVPGDEGKEAVPAARRNVAWSADGSGER